MHKANADGRQFHGDRSSLTTGYTHYISTWKKAPIPQFEEQPQAHKTCLANKTVYGVNHRSFLGSSNNWKASICSYYFLKSNAGFL